MARYEQLLPYVTSHTKSISEPEILHWLKHATKELVSYAALLKLESTYTLEENTQYFFPPSRGYNFARLLEVRGNEGQYPSEFLEDVKLVKDGGTEDIGGYWKPPNELARQRVKVLVTYCQTTKVTNDELPDLIYETVPREIGYVALGMMGRDYHRDPNRDWVSVSRETMKGSMLKYAGGIPLQPVDGFWRL